MSTLPTQPPECERCDDITYAAPPADERNGIAVGALVCGVLGLVMCPPLGVLGIIFGIIGIVRSRSTVPLNRGRGRAITGLVCGIGGVMLWSLLAPRFWTRLNTARGPHPLSYCASNLRGIGQGLKVYANENNDWYPVAPFAPPGDAGAPATAVSFIGNLSEAMTLPPHDMPRGLSNVHPSRSLFLLVTDSTCSTGQFVCPTSGDIEDDLQNPDGTTARPGIDRFDFRGYNRLSYGCLLPYGQNVRPGENLDPRMAIGADKGPYFQAGTPIANGARIPDAARGRPGSPIPGPGPADVRRILQQPFTAWKPFNSPNHGGAGQSVLFQDGHAMFAEEPIVGADFDNIYTVQLGGKLLNVLLGRQPADFVGPLTNTDAVIVP